MMSTPTVSIGMPVYNAERYLRRAIDALLAQDFGDFELILSDNGSTDGTEALCRDYAARDARIQFVRHPENQGSIWNFTHVLEAARGEFFLWAAHDDAYAPAFLSKCLDRLRNAPSAVGCCSEVVFLDEAGQIKPGWTYVNLDTLGMAPADRILELFRRMGWFATYSLFRREALLKTLPLPKAYGSDVISLLDVLLLGDITKVPEPLFLLTVAEKSKSAEDYTQAMEGAERPEASASPYTGLARDLWVRAFQSPLSEAEKGHLFSEAIRILTFENLDWRGRILAELGPEAGPIQTEPDFARYLGKLMADAVGRQAKETEPGRLVLASPRALVFFPHNPWPSRTGAHSRCLALLKGIRALGHDITLCGSSQFSDQPWTPEARDFLERALGVKVHIHAPDAADRAWVQDHWTNAKGLNLELYTPPGLRRLFTDLQTGIQADLVLVNYAYWGGLIDGAPFRKALCVLDSHDLLAPNTRLNQALQSFIPKGALTPSAPDLPWLADACGESLLGGGDDQDEAEFQVYDRFDLTLAISESETRTLASHCQRTHVAWVPMCHDVPSPEARRKGRPVFLASDNLPNQQGYLYFVSRVLPLIRKEIPDFEIGVAGALCRHIPATPGVVALGYVEDLAALYAEAGFAICPLLTGTGQQVKVTEAMAHGVPAVVHQAVAANSPVIQGQNGLVAADPEAFADACIRLMKDPDLRGRLGQEARRTMQARGSFGFMAEQLRQALQEAARVLRDRPKPARILYVRTDAIGDALLSNATLPHIRERWPEDSITVLCQERVAELYRACPLVDQVLTFDRGKAVADGTYRQALLAQVQNVGADRTLCPVYSREVLTDLLVAASQAPVRIGMEGDLSNQSPEEKAQTDPLYTRLIPSREGATNELDHHQDFLRGLGIETEGLEATVWTTEEDERFAEAYFQREGLARSRVLAFFPGAQYDVRIYGGYRPVLERLASEGWRILAFGSRAEAGLCAESLRGLAGTANLCGQASLGRVAALLRRCTLGLGAESGLAHLCSAVGLPHAIVLGGGHFGRFCPSSPKTVAAVLPLDCYLCNWQCPYDRAHCVKDLASEVVFRAVELALQPSDRPRLVAQEGGFDPGPGRPALLDLQPLLNPETVELHVVPVAGGGPGSQRPALTLVVPSTQRPDLLEAFLDSIPGAMSGLPFEVIGISPEGDAATRKVFQKHSVRWMSEESIKPGPFNWSVVMNAGFREAKAPWVMYASDDIRVEAGSLAKALALGDLCGSEVAGVSLLESTPAEPAFPTWHMRLTQGGRLMIHFGIVRKDTFLAVGGFDEKLRFYCADWDFCLRLYESGSVILPLSEGRCFHEAPLDEKKRANASEWEQVAHSLKAHYAANSILRDPVYPVGFLTVQQAESLERQEAARLAKGQVREEGEAWRRRLARWKQQLPDFPLLEELGEHADARDPRTTVFCAVWHKDPKRFERLKGHQACLDAQAVPVDRVYVFDGGDQPPEWLKGRIVSFSQPLDLYEAWNVALSVVRTPYVMNLNLDDRLNREAVAVFEQVLDQGADLVGGDWQICFSQEETDATGPSLESAKVPFRPEWPPRPGRPTRLGSGTGERGTYGPACAWRMALHEVLPRYPWRFKDGSPIRIIGDSVWWRLLSQQGKVLKRVPAVLGRYHSHPEDQAEFRNPASSEEEKLGRVGLTFI